MRVHARRRGRSVLDSDGWALRMGTGGGLQETGTRQLVTVKHLLLELQLLQLPLKAMFIRLVLLLLLL